jgi:mannosyltransferase
LGEHFRRVTSNATRAVCLYEVVSPEHWLSEAPLVPPTESSDQVDDVKSIAALRLHRPGPGSFALEHRMKDYDWFWRVEPGVSSTLWWYQKNE